MLITTVCAALSAAGLAVAFLTAYRRRFAAALRLAGIALVPVGLAMSGLVGLAGKLGTAIGGWAAGLVLNPVVWSGFAVLAVAFVLYVAGRAAARGKSGTARSHTARSRTADGAADRSEEPGALARREERSLGAPQQEGASGKQPAADGGEDFSEVEAILKKHGI